MISLRRLMFAAAALAAILALSLAPSTALAQAATYSVLHKFQDGSVPNDGLNPFCTLALGVDGNFYGVSRQGGSANEGVAFKMTPAGTITVLHSFADGSVVGDAAWPNSLIRGKDGNFYGTSYYGGSTYVNVSNRGFGAVFKMTPTGTVTILHSFSTGAVVNDGRFPSIYLTQGSDTNIYGTTTAGGSQGKGVYFRAGVSGSYQLLHSVQDGTVLNEGIPGNSALVQASDGNFYGTTDSNIFRMTPQGSIRVLQPLGSAYGGLTLGNDGNLYGVTAYGGASAYGTFFKTTLTGSVTVLKQFTADIAHPARQLTLGPDGNFYSAASDGNGNGVLFRVTPGGGLTLLHTFAAANPSDGLGPFVLTHGTNGNFYGCAATGGVGNNGTIFKLTIGSATANFVKFDTTTQGNWRDGYGSDGYNVIGDTSTNNPYYHADVSASPGVHNSGLWAAASLSPACLQTTQAGKVGSPTRLAGVWFQTTWTMNVNVDGTRQLALYLLDQPGAGYAETITIKDPFTGAVLDTRTASNFGGGEYCVWSVSGDVNITFTSTAGHWAVLSGIFFDAAGLLKEPAAPTNVTVAPSGTTLKLTWTASQGATSYYVYRGTTPGGESATPIASAVTTPSFTNTGLVPNTTYYYKIIAVSSSGGSFASAEASGTTSPPATAVFVKTDTSTQGNWKGVYGADGWNVIGDVSGNNPTNASYATVTAGTHNAGVWASTSTNPACLQKAAVGSTDRMAGVWFQTTWSMTVNVTGTHQLALYFLDLNNAGYAETVTIKDAATGAVLDTRPVSSFTGGVYEVWNVSGNVTVTFTPTAGKWAVVNGIFFG